MLLTIPVTVVLLLWTGVGGSWCPSLWIIKQTTFAPFVLWNSAPNSALAADNVTVLRRVHMKSIGLFKKIGLSSIGISPKKKCPPIQLCAFGSVK